MNQVIASAQRVLSDHSSRAMKQPVAHTMMSTSSLVPSVKCTVCSSTRSMPGRTKTLPSLISCRMSPVPGLTVGCTCICTALTSPYAPGSLLQQTQEHTHAHADRIEICQASHISRIWDIICVRTTEWQGWFVHMSSHLMKQGHVKKNLRISSYMPLGKQQSSAPAAGQIWAGEI